MHSIFRFMLILAFLAQSACVSHNYSAERKNELHACRALCQERANACDKVCHNNCKQCTTFANCSTAYHYKQYKHEQCVQGGTIARELKSYRDPLQCRKTTCDCSADYQLCRQSCDGLIHKRLQVAKTCC